MSHMLQCKATFSYETEPMLLCSVRGQNGSATINRITERASSQSSESIHKAIEFGMHRDVFASSRATRNGRGVRCKSISQERRCRVH